MSHENSMSEAGGRRDTVALEALLAINKSMLYHAAARLLRNPEDSEDALQDGMLSAFLHLDQFQGRSRLSTWMHTIVSNAAMSQLRKRSRLQVIPIVDDFGGDDENDERESNAVLIDSRPNPEEKCASEERTRILKERLRELPPNYRLVVQMCIFDGLLQKEAAQRLGVSTNTVKSRLHRACARLAKHV